MPDGRMPGESGKKKEEFDVRWEHPVRRREPVTQLRESEMVKGTRRVPEVNLMALNFGTLHEKEREKERESEAHFVVKAPANNERSRRPDKNLVDFLCVCHPPLSKAALPHYVSDRHWSATRARSAETYAVISLSTNQPVKAVRESEQEHLKAFSSCTNHTTVRKTCRADK